MKLVSLAAPQAPPMLTFQGHHSSLSLQTLVPPTFQELIFLIIPLTSSRTWHQFDLCVLRAAIVQCLTRAYIFISNFQTFVCHSIHTLIYIQTEVINKIYILNSLEFPWWQQYNYKFTKSYFQSRLFIGLNKYLNKINFHFIFSFVIIFFLLKYWLTAFS